MRIIRTHEQESWLVYILMLSFFLGLIVIILGSLGFMNYYDDRNEYIGFLDAFYLTMQLFFLNSVQLAPPIGWKLNIARFVAPFILGSAAVVTFLFLVLERLVAPFRRFFWKRHVVIGGLGEKGLQLARDYCAVGSRVIAIEKNTDNPNIGEAESIGVLVLTGDATFEPVQQRAMTHQADSIMLVMDSDGKNVQAATVAAHLVKNRRKKGYGPLKCFVHIWNPGLRMRFRRNPGLFIQLEGKLHATVVGMDCNENCARQVFKKFPIDYQPVKELTRIHLVIVNFDHMGQAMLLQAVKLAQFANASKIRATIYHTVPGNAVNDFLSRYPNINELCEYEVGEIQDNGMDIIDQMTGFCKEDNFLVTYVFCLNEDDRNLELALNLRAKISGCRSPILVRMSSGTGFSSILSDRPEITGTAPAIHAFGTVEEMFSREILLQEKIDVLAKAFHEHYRQKRLQEGIKPGDSASMQEWSNLHDDFKESNRQQADHIPVKLRAIGLHTKSSSENIPEPVKVFSNTEIELLAKMEHQRFIAERILAGWTYARQKNLELKTSPYLVPWGDLTEEVKEYDREAVRLIPEILEMGGLRIYR